ncbi:MAG: hypothetical protein OM95_10650 [Bdellovibrio sp. ArHS]|uniref:IPT/TIG domain-containing protein n=1 Tax=Bdellovibrio sp. ArHS TaxID=1569284 RepID=UPI0005835E77|nr:IPT/TIG domain-containing protein [Bdellovibrio sp. ArHS]KHD87983.1 MAG: hypothetical protein OM95_10650 [Bdellovibrio sp. ArHS]
MFRLIFTGILLWASCAFSTAKDSKNLSSLEFTRLIKKLNISSQYSIGSIRLSPSQPKQGDKVTVFIELSTEFEGNKTVRSVVALKVNGADVKVSSRSERLWISSPITFHSTGPQSIEIQAFVEDANVSNQLHQALMVLNREIDQLSNEILRELDPIRRAQLEATLDQKNTQKIDFENTLNSLKRAVATKTEVVSVTPASGTIYPTINSLEPNYGSISGGYQVKAVGENLSNVQSLKIGGVTLNSSQLSISNSDITFNVPPMSVGMHDIAVTRMIDGLEATTELKNAFFALDGNISGPSNSHPVAFAGFPQHTQSGVSTSLDGSRSYDDGGQSLTYSWSVVSKPEGATVLDGILSDPTVINPSFLAHTAGSYVLALVVSNGALESVPSLTVITVGELEAVTVIPQSIAGTAVDGSFYVGMFRVCNNLNSEASYQIMGSGYSLLMGAKAGTLIARSCLNFQFSVIYSGNGELKIDIPVILKGVSNSRKIIQVSITPASPSSLSFFGKFNSLQWSGEQNIDEIAAVSPVGLYGTHDSVSTTVFEIRNRSNTSYTITNPPLITHMGGATGIFSASLPPGGLSICAGCVSQISINVMPGNFNGADTAQGIFEWDAIPGEAPKVFIVKAAKLPAPASIIYELNFGDVEANRYVPTLHPNILNDFFQNLPAYSLFKVTGIAEGLSGKFDWFHLPFAPLMLGSTDYIQPTMSISVDLNPTSTLGIIQDEVSIDIEGYTTPLKYILKANIIPQTLLHRKQTSSSGSAK